MAMCPRGHYIMGGAHRQSVIHSVERPRTTTYLFIMSLFISISARARAPRYGDRPIGREMRWSYKINIIIIILIGNIKCI